jgi:hypothetical protein
VEQQFKCPKLYGMWRGGRVVCGVSEKMQRKRQQQATHRTQSRGLHQRVRRVSRSRTPALALMRTATRAHARSSSRLRRCVTWRAGQWKRGSLCCAGCDYRAGAVPKTTLQAGHEWMVSFVESTQKATGAHGLRRTGSGGRRGWRPGDAQAYMDGGGGSPCGAAAARRVLTQHPIRHRPPQMSQVSRPADMFTDVEMVALLRAKRREVRRGGAASVLPATPFCAATDEPVRAHERPGGHALGVVNLRVHRRSLHDHDRLLLHHDGCLHGHGHGLRDDDDLDARGGRKSSGCHATRPPPCRAAPRSGRGVSNIGWRPAASSSRRHYKFIYNDNAALVTAAAPGGRSPTDRETQHAPAARRRGAPPAQPRRQRQQAQRLRARARAQTSCRAVIK